MIVFLILNIPRLFLLGFEVERILKFRTCMVSRLTCFLLRCLWGLNSNSIWRKIFVQLLTWFNQDQPYPQLANFEYQTRTEVTIFFYIVKLCTLLNRLPEKLLKNLDLGCTIEISRFWPTIEISRLGLYLWTISFWTEPSKYLELDCTFEISRLGLYLRNISTNWNLHLHFFTHCAVNWA